MVAGHGGPSLARPSSRATTRAAARSLSHGTSVEPTVPNEPHSSTARNTAPYPDAGTAADADRDAVAPPDRPSPEAVPPVSPPAGPAGLWQPVRSRAHSTGSSAHRTPAARLSRIAVPLDPRSSVTRRSGRTPDARGASGTVAGGAPGA